MLTSAFLLRLKANYLEKMRGYPAFFFVDSNSPCEDLVFPRSAILAQKPLYLVGTVLKLGCWNTNCQLNFWQFLIYQLKFQSISYLSVDFINLRSQLSGFFQYQLNPIHTLLLQVTVAYLPIICRRIPKSR